MTANPSAAGTASHPAPTDGDPAECLCPTEEEQAWLIYGCGEAAGRAHVEEMRQECRVHAGG